MNKERDSILISIKKLLGIPSDYNNFDTDIIIHINSVFMILNQLGVGPKEGYRIEGPDDFWDDYITENDDLDAVKTYMYLKVKSVFDPPLNSSIIEANKQVINELEWRLNVNSDKGVD